MRHFRPVNGDVPTRGLRLVAVISILLLGPSCPGERVDYVAIIRNESGETVKIVYKSSEERRNLGFYGNRDQLAFGIPAGDCTTGSLVAFSLEGQEIDRQNPGLCADETWIIENEEDAGTGG
jgi:hypothetical protein